MEVSETPLGFAMRMYMAGMRKWKRLADGLLENPEFAELSKSKPKPKGRVSFDVRDLFPPEWTKMKQDRERS